MNIVLCLAHSVEEENQVRLLTSLGYKVFSIGAYSEPANPQGSLRPPVPEAPDYPELRQACWEVRHAHREDSTRVVIDGQEREIVDWAKYELPQAVLDWADVVVYHHFEHSWLFPNWARLRDSGKRIVWRTVGQSVAGNEAMMAPLFADGLQIVRYSPKERNIPGYAGETALIRFYGDPNLYGGWTGDMPAVINFTQNFLQRSLGDNGQLQPPGKQYTNYGFWAEATKGLPSIAMGPGSEAVNGTGELGYDKMREMLRRSRAYLYTGTQPASYTLGLIEAMLSGIPVVSIGPSWHQVFQYGPRLFEGHEIARFPGPMPSDANRELRRLLSDSAYRNEASAWTRERAIELFGMAEIGRQWKAFLG